MSSDQAGAVPASPPDNGGAGTELCVLLACFAGSKRAAKIRGQLDKRIGESGDTIVDQLVLTVDAKHKALVYDPRRTLAGTLTAALTWGIFGLIAGGLRGLAIWAVIGAICGGVYAYYTEHLLTKNELKRIGGRLPGNSSAIVAFVHGSDPQRVLSSTASCEPTTASVAAIAADLSARVYSGAAHPAAAPATAAGAVPDRTAGLSMLVVRFGGEHAARQALGTSGSAKHQDPRSPQVEYFVETNKQGRRRVFEPVTGVGAMSKNDVISWGAFGLVYGAIVGFAGNGGALSSVKSGLVTGLAWALFGLVAGALYGLWAGRGVSARRLSDVGSLVPPGTSSVLAWADGNLTQQAIDSWSAPGSKRLILRFNPVGDGILLEV